MKLILSCPECGGVNWRRNDDPEGPMFVCEKCGLEEDPENMDSRAEEE